MWGGCRAPQTGERARINPTADSSTATSATSNPPSLDPDAPPLGPIIVREENYDSGSVAKRVEGYLDADGNLVRHGLMTTWYEDGVKKSEIAYAHGKLHGMRTTWYPTGQMWGRGQYVNGKEDGTWTAWWPNGFKQREWHMKRGTWDGPFTEWHSNGEKKREFQYINGLKQGTVRVWDEQGTLVRESEYVDDVEQPK